MNMNWKGLQSSANLGDAWDTSHRQQLIVLVKSSFFSFFVVLLCVFVRKGIQFALRLKNYSYRGTMKTVCVIIFAETEE